MGEQRALERRRVVEDRHPRTARRRRRRPVLRRLACGDRQDGYDQHHSHVQSQPKRERRGGVRALRVRGRPRATCCCDEGQAEHLRRPQDLRPPRPGVYLTILDRADLVEEAPRHGGRRSRRRSLEAREEAAAKVEDSRTVARRRQSPRRPEEHAAHVEERDQEDHAPLGESRHRPTAKQLGGVVARRRRRSTSAGAGGLDPGGDGAPGETARGRDAIARRLGLDPLLARFVWQMRSGDLPARRSAA